MTDLTNKPYDQSCVQSIAGKVKNFVETYVIPMETQWLNKEKSKELITSELLDKSLNQNLWGLFYPKNYGGKIHSLEDYLVVAEQEGRSELSQPLFGCQSALDAHMLAQFAAPDIQNIFLAPMVTAQATPSYAMTEPEQPGSVPTLLNTQATKKETQWVINGKKWFICNAKQATFVTVVVCTNTNVSADKAYSMLLVPADSPGFTVDRSVSVLGRDTGQGELSFHNVHIPRHYMLGKEGQGMELIKYRLGMGRVLRAMHWIGMAQRCFDLMGQRIHTSKSQAAKLDKKQLIKQLFFNTHQQITSAREILRLAARQVDQQILNTKYASAETQTDYSNNTLSNATISNEKPSPLLSTLVSSAKVACSNALYTAADSAIQVYGAEGLTDQTPLSNLFRAARATRIMDGANEALISSAGGQLINHYRDNTQNNIQGNIQNDAQFDFSLTDLCR